MVQFSAMTEDDYQRFFVWAIDDYAEQQIKAGAWPKDHAKALAKKTFEALLPHGLTSPHQYLYMIQRKEDGVQVGQVWWGIQEQEDKRFATLNDFHIFKEYRRQGYGNAALQEMEQRLLMEGLDKVFLHVFGHNEAARAMYRKLGYLERNITMVKDLI